MSDTAWDQREGNPPAVPRAPRRPRTASELADSAPRPHRYVRTANDGLPVQPPHTMQEVEERILRADDELAELTAVHMDLADMSAEAEADWKAHRDRVIQEIVDKDEERTAADYREAKARNAYDPETKKYGRQLYREYKKATNAMDSSARAMRAIEARLNAFQTMAANLRKSMGPG